MAWAPAGTLSDCARIDEKSLEVELRALEKLSWITSEAEKNLGEA